jgi:hypothetical protein
MTAFSAIISTAVWYANAPDDKYRVGMLALILWGATIMWFVDAVVALTEGEKFFEMTSDGTLLGFSSIILALLIWEASLLINDPKGVLKKALKN